MRCSLVYFFFFFNDTATTEIYTLSLHDALPISSSTAATPTTTRSCSSCRTTGSSGTSSTRTTPTPPRRSPQPRSRTSRCCRPRTRSEEHTSELQSRSDLVCRLLLEKKKTSLDEQ